MDGKEVGGNPKANAVCRDEGEVALCECFVVRYRLFRIGLHDVWLVDRREERKE